MSRLGLVLSLFAFLMSPLAMAYQQALVTKKHALVHERPDSFSKSLTQKKVGEVIYVSSNRVEGRLGGQWFKTKVDKGQFGYILAMDVRTKEDVEDQKNSGISLTRDTQRVAVKDEAWNFVTRFMGQGGVSASPIFFVYGGEVEVAANLLFGLRGYFKRMLAIGAAYQWLNRSQTISGSIIFRAFTETDVIPEFRVRVGSGSATGVTDRFMVLGFTGGIRYPFSTTFGTHLSGYMEMGGSVGLGGGSPMNLWTALGLGLHF